MRQAIAFGLMMAATWGARGFYDKFYSPIPQPSIAIVVMSPYCLTFDDAGGIFVRRSVRHSMEIKSGCLQCDISDNAYDFTDNKFLVGPE